MDGTLLRRVLLALLLAAAMLSIVAPEARAAIKLFLKDGTYHLVKSYEVLGDRVRFYSAERSQWEEIPTALVDFAATERARQEEEAVKEQQLDEARELARQRFERPWEEGIEIAPGIHLPKEEGVFAFDGVRVIRMIQSSAEIVKDKKRAVLLLLSGPILKNRAFVVLPNSRAAIRVGTTRPVFYVQSADRFGAGVELFPLKPRKAAREVEKLEWRGGKAHPSELRAAVPLEREEVAPGVFKLSPLQPLELGEYALGELIEEKLNLELWDFGIDGAPRE